MSMYEISGESVLIPGLDGAFTRRSLGESPQIPVLCGGYCWTCGNYSPNPGCRKEADLRIPFESVCPKYWNELLKWELIK